MSGQSELEKLNILYVYNPNSPDLLAGMCNATTSVFRIDAVFRYMLVITITWAC
jgi:hypothetical protein